MERLTNKQIERIDDELFYLNMKFIDIRYEMTDHIASAIEEMDGSFKDNFKEYFILNRNRLIKQYKKTRNAAILRAIKYYFKTMFNPVVFALATALFFVLYFCSIVYIDDAEIIFFGQCTWFVMLLPLYWLAKNNRKISVLRPMVTIQSVLYTLQQGVTIWTYRIDDRQLRMVPLRISSCAVPALMIILLISLYRYRKQYAKQYI